MAVPLAECLDVESELKDDTKQQLQSLEGVREWDDLDDELQEVLEGHSSAKVYRNRHNPRQFTLLASKVLQRGEPICEYGGVLKEVQPADTASADRQDQLWEYLITPQDVSSSGLITNHAE